MDINSGSIFQNEFITLSSLIISSLLGIILFISMIKRDNKKQMTYAFLATIIMEFIWSIGSTAEFGIYMATGEINIFATYTSYVGLCFLPVTIFYVGLIFELC